MTAPPKSPTATLLFGLAVTLAAVVVYSSYIVGQIKGLRELQSGSIDRNRRHSLQLLRIQNDLNSLGLAMRDMLDGEQPYPLTAWSAQLRRIRADLDDAMRQADALAIAQRSADQRKFLASSLAQFWNAVDRMFALAEAGEDKGAREQIRISLQARQAALSTAVSRLMVQNNETEQEAVLATARIYDRVERQVYLFFGATLIAISLTGLYLAFSNRRLFASLEALSAQRSELAQKLIATQESTLRHISRELHDEFGQILTALGSMLGRAQRGAPLEFQSQLGDIREIAQSSLDKVRTLSQALHPVTLDVAGLESTIEWYLPSLEKQTGITAHYDRTGTSATIDATTGIHVYRILQEALNNVTRHSKAKEAWVKLDVQPDQLQLQVEDHGIGFDSAAAGRGIGLVAMRERAELLGGQIEFLKPAGGGTVVRLTAPLKREDEHAR